MWFYEPKNTETIFWTEHSKEKMKFYNLSENRLKSILRNPHREEKGIAPRTVAIMQATKSKKPTEIWLMYQIASLKGAKLLKRSLAPYQKAKIKKKNERIVIISAWRYPGTSPVGAPPIPSEVLKILQDINII